MMYKIGDIVLYSLNTICRIDEIAVRDFGGKETEYFFLRPVYDENATIYIPTDNDVLKRKMRSILSKEEVYRLIHAMPEIKEMWIEDENKRREVFHNILAEGDRRKLIMMIKTIYLHQQNQLKNNKRKLHISDERFFKDAEKLLYDEFAYVLGIEPHQVIDFIHKEINSSEQESLAVN